jgi:hypothetical protein
MGSIIGAGASIIAGNKAAKKQASAAASDRALAQEIFDQQRADLEPFRQSGLRAQEALDFELGLGERPSSKGLTLEGNHQDGFRVGTQDFETRNAALAFIDENNGFGYTGFKETPGYQFALDEGNRGLERSAAARGATQGGAFAKDLARFNQGLANQEYNTYLNRLGSQSGAGQVATNNVNTAAGAFGQQAGAAIQRAGDAKASAFVNTGNAIRSGIQQEEQNNFQAAGIGASFFGSFLGGG